MVGQVGRRVAAIDCGTNSIRLLIADVAPGASGPQLIDVHRQLRMVRLGEGIDATGQFSPAALDRTWRALSDYAAIIAASQVTPGAVRMTATSAARDAHNRDEFFAMVRRTLGQDPEIIAGETEASLSFKGAVGDLDPADGPFLVFDIGGGSTEFVIGTRARDGSAAITAAISENIGSVRITERVLHSDPPTTGEIAAGRQWANQIVADALSRLTALSSVRHIVAVAGTATTVTAAARDLPLYDPAKIHLARLTPGAIDRAAHMLLRATRAHRAALGYMHPGRVDVIGGGALVFATIAQALTTRTGLPTLTVSEHDILDGIALSLA